MPFSRRILSLLLTLGLCPASAWCLQQSAASLPETHERSNIFYQATSIGSTHGAFLAPYSGPFSLQSRREAEVSLTTTLYLGLRPAKNTQIYLNPEIAGGRGFSGVNGLANQYNGELPRVGSATPKPYIARAYITQDFPLGSEVEPVTSDMNQLAGPRPVRRYSVSVGRFTITDFFDDNRYTHDPRTQFMGWAVMYNGAWDYPADTRGYTWGWVHELHMNSWSLRYGSVAEPREANGLRFDRRIFVNRGDVVEGDKHYAIHEHSGTVRILGYLNHANAGNYGASIDLSEKTGTRPDVTATRRNGTRKYGTGLSADQEITHSVGAFLRLGWNDGKTESFAFDAIDRLLSSGISLNGNLWNRSSDSAGTALTMSGISDIHSQYLTRGGFDFLIGDGALRYGREYSWESYYSASLWRGFFVSFDLQHVTNPAYNRDRGPVWISNLRLHLELNRKRVRAKPAAVEVAMN